ncbi:DUF547 domain-containing protein [Spirosoma endbachense]|uniref:DUF547 domain-containing protein n=1 Tax=Spirosoma endbachense TaxID=2666025 RepID=A0A6P1W8V1_9BACT|nr:DUF547 domain-containing protein [Spirosoma endbachense]QHW00468.1 DUF547 domain-containing protein [Spirosoma endbachense]
MTRCTLKGMTIGLLGLTLAGLAAFTPPINIATGSVLLTSAPVDHGSYDRLLKKYVNEKGLVNYKGFKADEKELKKYLDVISNNPPTDKWSKNDQMAYWINAYNAYTIQLILNHYPVSSIKDIGSRIKIPFVTTPWASKFFKIGGEEMSLDNIEHGTLRKKFNEPRIHFALVCAARSCPRLRNEAYEGDKLIAQLDDQGSDFLNNPAKNAITPQKASLSKYFDWYKGDWKENNKSIEYWVNQYSKTKINKDTPISFLDYNWALNEQ